MPDLEGRRVGVVGEHDRWSAPTLVAPGEAELALSLPVGIYAYKLHVDGRAELDPEGPATRSREGRRNHLLVVGGAPEPLLFAPAPPFLSLDARGGVVLHAGVRRGRGARLAIRFDEEGRGAPSVIEATAVLEEDEHRLFRAHLPVSARRVALGFVIDDQPPVERDVDGAPLAFELDSLALEPPPALAALYTVFVDRFAPPHAARPWGEVPRRDGPAGGHLDGVTRALDELRALGVDALHLTPVHVGASPHRYDLVDPRVVDPALGGEPAFARLLDAAHARGMRVIVDVSFAHVGRGFPPYEDVRRNGASSRYAGWFRFRDDGALVCYGARDDAPVLALDHPEVQALALEVVEAWARRGVDGLRLDAAADVPFALGAAIRARLRAIAPRAFVLGEVVPAHAFRWHDEGVVDLSTEFGFQAIAVDLLATRSIDAAAAAARLRALDVDRGFPIERALRFVSTHDHARFASFAGGARARSLLGLFFLLTCPGVPALVYGEEYGLAADAPERVPEDAWSDRMPRPAAPDAEQRAYREAVAALLAMRRDARALREGSMEIVHAEGALLIYRRTRGDEVVDVAIHAGEERLEVSLEDDERAGVEILGAVGEASLVGETLTLVGPSALALARTRTPADRGRERLAARANARRRDQAAARGLELAGVRPTRLDLALTERCNLRCRHCLTRAPARTAAGSARTMPEVVLDRLRPALRDVEYVALSHGGESLVEPVLFELLDALRAARPGAPAMVHLLTNGALLDAETAARLYAASVRSIAVSIDGATPATNDAVRLGGSLAQIERNLAAVSALRRARGLDLRVGVSTVVLPENLDELPLLVDRVADLGLDWLKLEELVPVNEWSRRALARLEPPRLEGALSRARLRAEARGLVLVLHLREAPAFRCLAPRDPALARFLEADDFANRAVGHPCRAAWERACIEPDGDVHLAEFHGPRLGNLMDAELGALFDAPAAQLARRAVAIERPCGAPGCCDQGAPTTRTSSIDQPSAHGSGEPEADV